MSGYSLMLSYKSTDTHYGLFFKLITTFDDALIQ